MAPNKWTRWGGPSVFLHYVLRFCLFASPLWLGLSQQWVEYQNVG